MFQPRPSLFFVPLCVVGNEQEEDVEPPQEVMMVVLLMATIVTVRMIMKIFLITGTIMDLTIMT